MIKMGSSWKRRPQERTWKTCFSESCLVLLYINDINGGCVIVQEGLIVHIIYKHQFFDNTFYLSLLPSNVQLLICQCVCVPALYYSNVHVHIRPDLQKKGWFQRQREAQSFIPVCWRLIRSLILCVLFCADERMITKCTFNSKKYNL